MGDQTLSEIGMAQKNHRNLDAIRELLIETNRLLARLLERLDSGKPITPPEADDGGSTEERP